ncbi:4496_t:CDS:2 [Funneliformis geosporum]|uniref:Transmembrane protein 198 n=1 Tax=Funneliformis geosporum TaxID=1117311 RepID=A0A9W4WKG7_9GLOM|nr:4496_t:CDS:2 [Funneliformis geosporum]CAI2168692.1 18825_t:CDS:2 [Funneliformis geosporum]
MFAKSNLLLSLICLLGILFPLNINAQAKNPTIDLSDSNGKLTPHLIITGILLIITGIIFCFFGRRIYRLTLFMIGFYIGTIITWVGLTNGEPVGGYAGAETLSATIILIVSLAVGFVVGLTFLCCSTLAIWLLGALAGYTFALFILAWSSDGVIHQRVARIIFIVALTLIGLMLACFIKNTLIILATSFIGAYAIILGIDIFVRTGFAQSVRAFTDGYHDIPYKTNTKVYLMLGGMIALFIVGSLIQFRYHKNRFGPEEAASVEPQTGKKRLQLPWKRRNVV